MIDIKENLSFQMEVSFLDLGNREIPISKLGDFRLKYYVNKNLAVFEASKVGNNYSYCEAKDGKIIVTIESFSFIETGRLKCQMEYFVYDSVLPTNPFKFYCPEQLLDVNIV